MSLSGTFDTMQLCDLMQWVHSSSVTGSLNISIETEETYLFFHEGDLVAIGSDDPLRLELGRVLLSRGMIDADQLHDAAKQVQEGHTLVEALAKVGAMQEADIARAQEDHTFETVLDLFFLELGSFHLSTAGAPEGILEGSPDISQANFLRRPIDTQELIFEGMKRLDEWTRFREIFPNAYVVVEALDGRSNNAAWKELREIGSPLSVGELCLRMGGSRYEVYKKLYEAYNLGLIGLDHMPTGSADQAHLGPVEMLIQNARVLLSEQQFDEARTILSTASNLDPDNRNIRTMIKQIREAQIAALYQEIAPHKVPVLAVEREKLSDFQLSPREAFFASRLNGKWDVATLVVSTPLGELDTLRTLRKFIHAGIARMEE
jgi:hypothetical protein